jgi:hypothetical protein
MNTQQSFASEGACDDARLSSSEGPVWPSDGQYVRLERIGEYEDWGVAQAEPFAAFLAVIHAELFRAAYMLENSMEQLFSHCRSGADGIRVADRPITQYLRVLRQIEQNVGQKIVLKNRPPKR